MPAGTSTSRIGARSIYEYALIALIRSKIRAVELSSVSTDRDVRRYRAKYCSATQISPGSRNVRSVVKVGQPSRLVRPAARRHPTRHRRADRSATSAALLRAQSDRRHSWLLATVAAQHALLPIFDIVNLLSARHRFTSLKRLARLARSSLTRFEAARWAADAGLFSSCARLPDSLLSAEASLPAARCASLHAPGRATSKPPAVAIEGIARASPGIAICGSESPTPATSQSLSVHGLHPREGKQPRHLPGAPDKERHGSSMQPAHVKSRP